MFKFINWLPAFAVTTARLFLTQFVLLFILRLVFYFSGRLTLATDHSLHTALAAFQRGLLFDMSAAAYVAMPALLFLFVHEWIARRTNIFLHLSFGITLLVYFLYALVAVADFPYFYQFGTHVSRQALLWADSPAFVLRMILGSPAYYLYIFLLLALCWAEFLFLRFVYRSSERRRQTFEMAAARRVTIFLLFTLLLVGGARGRLSSKSTLHEGMAIVSEDPFMNQVALNADYTFFKSLLSSRPGLYHEPKDIDSSIAFARHYLGIKGPYSRSLSRTQKTDGPFRPYNVVVVCMESMSTYKTGMHGMPVLTPRFNDIITQSLYFDNFYSSGIHTFNGLFSVCSGFPATLRDHMLRRFTRKPFRSLGNMLEEKGYQTAFYSTHDPHFDNMASFFRLNGYRDVFSSDDLPSEKSISATGVPDHELFQLFLDKAAAYPEDKPFLAFIMTGSDHGPWAIPDNIPFKADAASEKERGTQYADWALGYLMENAKKQKWYENTLFVFVGDHGYHLPGTYDMPLSYQQVPFVMHMPSRLAPDTMHAPAYQPDIVATVAGFLNLPFKNEGFGIDLLRESHPFVFFTADDKRGEISDSGYFSFELLDQQSRHLYQFMRADMADCAGKQRKLSDSLCDGGRHLCDAAEYFLRSGYYSD